MNLHDGILHSNPRKLSVKVTDDFILKGLLRFNKFTFSSATKDIFNHIKYVFSNKKEYKTFLELMEIEVNCHNLKEKMKVGYYDHLFEKTNP